MWDSAKPTEPPATPLGLTPVFAWGARIKELFAENEKAKLESEETKKQANEHLASW